MSRADQVRDATALKQRNKKAHETFAPQLSTTKKHASEDHEAINQDIDDWFDVCCDVDVEGVSGELGEFSRVRQRYFHTTLLGKSAFTCSPKGSLVYGTLCNAADVMAGNKAAYKALKQRYSQHKTDLARNGRMYDDVLDWFAISLQPKDLWAEDGQVPSACREHRTTENEGEREYYEVGGKSGGKWVRYLEDDPVDKVVTDTDEETGEEFERTDRLAKIDTFDLREEIIDQVVDEESGETEEYTCLWETIPTAQKALVALEHKRALASRAGDKDTEDTFAPKFHSKGDTKFAAMLKQQYTADELEERREMYEWQMVTKKVIDEETGQWVETEVEVPVGLARRGHRSTEMRVNEDGVEEEVQVYLTGGAVMANGIMDERNRLTKAEYGFDIVNNERRHFDEDIDDNDEAITRKYYKAGKGWVVYDVGDEEHEFGDAYVAALEAHEEDEDNPAPMWETDWDVEVETEVENEDGEFEYITEVETVTVLVDALPKKEKILIMKELDGLKAKQRADDAVQGGPGLEGTQAARDMRDSKKRGRYEMQTRTEVDEDGESREIEEEVFVTSGELQYREANEKKNALSKKLFGIDYVQQFKRHITVKSKTATSSARAGDDDDDDDDMNIERKVYMPGVGWQRYKAIDSSYDLEEMDVDVEVLVDVEHEDEYDSEDSDGEPVVRTRTVVKSELQTQTVVWLVERFDTTPQRKKLFKQQKFKLVNALAEAMQRKKAKEINNLQTKPNTHITDKSYRKLNISSKAAEGGGGGEQMHDNLLRRKLDFLASDLGLMLPSAGSGGSPLRQHFRLDRPTVDVGGQLVLRMAGQRLRVKIIERRSAQTKLAVGARLSFIEDGQMLKAKIVEVDGAQAQGEFRIEYLGATARGDEWVSVERGDDDCRIVRESGEEVLCRETFEYPLRASFVGAGAAERPDCWVEVDAAHLYVELEDGSGADILELVGVPSPMKFKAFFPEKSPGGWETYKVKLSSKVDMAKWQGTVQRVAGEKLGLTQKWAFAEAVDQRVKVAALKRVDQEQVWRAKDATKQAREKETKGKPDFAKSQKNFKAESMAHFENRTQTVTCSDGSKTEITSNVWVSANEAMYEQAKEHQHEVTFRLFGVDLAACTRLHFPVGQTGKSLKVWIGGTGWVQYKLGREARKLSGEADTYEVSLPKVRRKPFTIRLHAKGEYIEALDRGEKVKIVQDSLKEERKAKRNDIMSQQRQQETFAPNTAKTSSSAKAARARSTSPPPPQNRLAGAANAKLYKLASDYCAVDLERGIRRHVPTKSGKMKVFIGGRGWVVYVIGREAIRHPRTGVYTVTLPGRRGAPLLMSESSSGAFEEHLDPKDKPQLIQSARREAEKGADTREAAQFDFKPQTQKASKSSTTRHATPTSEDESAPRKVSRTSSRLYRQAERQRQNRSDKLREERERLQIAENETCTFAPNMSKSRKAKNKPVQKHTTVQEVQNPMLAAMIPEDDEDSVSSSGGGSESSSAGEESGASWGGGEVAGW